MYKQTNQLSEVMILGIPIDNVTLDSTVQKILSFIKSYQFDKRPRQIATVNVDFLVNALNWRLSKPARHPELLDILRHADLVTADGMPIVWLSKLLKTPLQERVTGADLVPALANKTSETGHSIFFLGGKGDIAQQAADKLKLLYPNLNIAGVYSPFVYTEGEKMLTSEQQDNEIIRRINQTNPDILLIGFGNPKQELWFNRNRHKLNVPVSIGIGGTYEFIVGNVHRAPLWMQNTGMEWIYRILQEPKRLWKRYAVGIIKLSFLCFPLLLQDKLQRYRITSIFNQKNKFPFKIHYERKSDELIVRLPQRLDSSNLTTFENNWKLYVVMYKKVIFDFTQVKFIDSGGLGKLVRLITFFQDKQVNIVSTGLINDNVIKLLKMTRIYDLINEPTTPEVYPSAGSLLDKNFTEEKFITIKTKSQACTKAKLVGRLDAATIANLDFEESISFLGEGNYILDLSELTFLDSSGLRFFFYLHRSLKERNKILTLVQPNEMVSQLLKITNLSEFFNINNSEINSKVA